MARRLKRYDRPSTSGDTAVAHVMSPDVLLENISHELKLMDIKRQAVRDQSARLPWVYMAAAIFGLFFLFSLLSISLLWIFVSGALLSGAIAGITGPLGAKTLRKQAWDDIRQIKQRLLPMVADLPAEINPVLFGVKKISRKDGIQLSAVRVPLKGVRENSFNENGYINLGYYEQLGLLFRGDDGKVNLAHPAISRQYWLMEARQKMLPEEAIQASLSTLKQEV